MNCLWDNSDCPTQDTDIGPVEVEVCGQILSWGSIESRQTPSKTVWSFRYYPCMIKILRAPTDFICKINGVNAPLNLSAVFFSGANEYSIDVQCMPMEDYSPCKDEILIAMVADPNTPNILLLPSSSSLDYQHWNLRIPIPTTYPVRIDPERIWYSCGAMSNHTISYGGAAYGITPIAPWSKAPSWLPNGLTGTSAIFVSSSSETIFIIDNFPSSTEPYILEVVSAVQGSVGTATIYIEHQCMGRYPYACPYYGRENKGQSWKPGDAWNTGEVLVFEFVPQGDVIRVHATGDWGIIAMRLRSKSAATSGGGGGAKPGALIGGIIGGVAFIIGFCIYCYYKQKCKSSDNDKSLPKPTPMDEIKSSSSSISSPSEIEHVAHVSTPSFSKTLLVSALRPSPYQQQHRIQQAPPCGGCGAVVPDGALFCMRCGAKQTTCPECGVRQVAGATFCGRCGTALEDAGPIPVQNPDPSAPPPPGVQDAAPPYVPGGPLEV